MLRFFSSLAAVAAEDLLDARGRADDVSSMTRGREADIPH